MARGIHPFSSRTRKLSLFALMVLGWTRPGRRWRRRISLKPRCECIEAFSVLLRPRVKGHMPCFCLQVGEITYKEYAHSSTLGEPCLYPFLRSRRQRRALGASEDKVANAALPLHRRAVTFREDARRFGERSSCTPLLAAITPYDPRRFGESRGCGWSSGRSF